MSVDKYLNSTAIAIITLTHAITGAIQLVSAAIWCNEVDKVTFVVAWFKLLVVFAPLGWLIIVIIACSHYLESGGYGSKSRWWFERD